MNGVGASQRGFTLLELVIALAIFSIAALAALKHSDQTLRQQSRLAEKTLALWVAENAIAELRLTSPWPAAAETSRLVSNGGREWRVASRISDTAHSSLRKVEVTVSLAQREQTLASLVGYLGEH